MKRATVLVPLCAVVLSGCSDMPRTWRQSEIEEIAANQAEDFADAGSDAARLDELEQRILKLERENKYQADMIASLTQSQKSMFDYLLPEKR